MLKGIIMLRNPGVKSNRGNKTGSKMQAKKYMDIIFLEEKKCEFINQVIYVYLHVPTLPCFPLLCHPGKSSFMNVYLGFYKNSSHIPPRRTKR